MLIEPGADSAVVSRDGIVNQPYDGSTRSVGNQLIFDARAAWIE